MTSAKISGIEDFKGDLDDEGLWDLAKVTGGLDLASGARIHVDNDHLGGVCIDASWNDPLSVFHLPYLAYRLVNVLGKVIILEFRMGALDFMVAVSNTGITELQPQLASKTLEPVTK